MPLVLGSTDSLPSGDDVDGKLQIHGDDECPDELRFPTPGHQSQKRYAKRRFRQPQRDRL